MRIGRANPLKKVLGLFATLAFLQVNESNHK